MSKLPSAYIPLDPGEERLVRIPKSARSAYVWMGVSLVAFWAAVACAIGWVMS